MRYVLLIILLATPAALWAGWESETIAAEGDVGSACSLAVDRWGRPHVAYYDKTNSNVMYARFTGSAWEFGTVARDVEVAGNLSLALDAFDRPYILFQDDVEDVLLYAYLSGATWRTQEVDEGENYGLHVSVAAWPTGPRVTYTTLSGLTTYLRYGYREGTAWETETIGTGGTQNRLITDEAGTPHVFYGKGITIEHSFKENEDWETEDIDEGLNCHATLAPDKKFHVSFVSADNTELFHAYSDGSSWSVEKATGATGSLAFNQICLNVAGHIYISYFDQSGGDLHVMLKKGTSWSRELVAETGFVGNPHSMVLGDDGYPLIAYYDATEGDLKLARYDPETGVELTSFAARRTRDGVALSWNVVRAESVVGYNLYRETVGAERARVNDAPIVGTPPFRYLDGAAPAEARSDYWLEVVAATGATRTFGPASVPPATKPGAFALRQNVPNPAAGATTFSFELPAGADVTLAVYDASGRRVATVAEGYFPAGAHDVPFANGLAPGVYVYRLETASNSAARKMVVTR
jgi:hypothetical protein